MDRKELLIVVKELNQSEDLLAQVGEKKIIVIGKGSKTTDLIENFGRVMLKLDDAGLTDEISEDCIDFFEDNVDEFMSKKDDVELEEIEKEPVEEMKEEAEKESKQETEKLSEKNSKEEKNFADELSEGTKQEQGPVENLDEGVKEELVEDGKEDLGSKLKREPEQKPVEEKKEKARDRKTKKKDAKKKQEKVKDRKSKYTRVQAFCDALQGKAKTIIELAEKAKELYDKANPGKEESKLSYIQWTIEKYYIVPFVILGFVELKGKKYSLKREE
jgi:hypothetical protein